VQKRKEGVPPQDISPEITDPQVERIMGLQESEFLNISDVFSRELKKGPTNFEVKRCSRCGEATFVNKLAESPDGSLFCIPCMEQGRKA
jgi:formylmethanofuran dehydrogenase subunit E